MNKRVKEIVRLANQLPNAEREDFLLYLKTRLAMNRAWKGKYKPPSMEQWERIPFWGKWTLFFLAVFWSSMTDITRKINQVKMAAYGDETKSPGATD